MLEERKLKEIEHSDRRRAMVRGYEYCTDTSCDALNHNYIEERGNYKLHFSNMKFYSITQLSSTYRDSLLFENIKGKRVLDYCCGNGEIAVEMAKRGASEVFGIDISPVAIENASFLARSVGVGSVCNFKVMDAENTDFADKFFDLIHEYGALHHLELRKASAELARILKPEGKLICTEALRNNPLIHWYRKHTPQLRTKWEVEHILSLNDLNQIKLFFSEIDVRFFHLTCLMAVPLRKTRFFDTACKLLDSIDSIILKKPCIGKYAWIMVFDLKRPKVY